MEFRPFTLVNASTLSAEPSQPIYRKSYVVKKLGKEQAEMKLKALFDLAEKNGLKMSVSL